MADMQLPPLPDGYAPGQTRVPLLWGITFSFGMVATFLAVLRLYVRVRLLHSVGKDDWLLIAALVFSWALGALGVWGIKAGFGRHMYDIVKEGIDPHNFFYLAVFIPVLYNLSQLSIQLSLLTFYLRLSFSRRLTYMTYVIMVIAVLNAVASITINLLFLLANIGDNSWKDFRAIYYVNSTVNLTLDFSIWCLPLSSIWRLQQLNFQKRLAIIATFSVGLFCCLSGVVRSAYIHGASQMRGDETWDKIPIHILFIVETTLAISGASMAVLKPLLAKLGYIGENSIISRGSNPNQQEPGQGNNINNKRTAPSAFVRNISLSPSTGLSTFASSVGGRTHFDGADEGGDAHARTGHGQPTDFELGNLDESIHEEVCDQDLAVSSSKKSQKTSSTFGILRTCTIETRHERIDEHGHSESTVSLAGTKMATSHGSLAPNHHYHHHETETGEVNTLEKRTESISSSFNTETQHAADLFTT